MVDAPPTGGGGTVVGPVGTAEVRNPVSEVMGRLVVTAVGPMGTRVFEPIPLEVQLRP